MQWIVVIMVAAVIIYVVNKKKDCGTETDKLQKLKYKDELKYNVDLSWSLEDCRKKVMEGNAKALFELGYRYYYSLDIKKNIRKAVYFTRLSADKNYIDGKFFYFVLYYNHGTSYNIDRMSAESDLKYLANLKKPVLYNAKYIIAQFYFKFASEPGFITTIFKGEDDAEKVYALLNAIDCLLVSIKNPSRFSEEEGARNLVKNIINLR